MSNTHLVKSEEIQNKIYTIRGIQVMLDEDLAYLYGVETRVLNQAVNRNKARFPDKFMFRITKEEFDSLRSQNVTLENEASLRSQNAILNETSNLISQSVISSSRHGGRRKLPYAFTEQGVAMLSAVLKSETAVKVSVAIMNAFVNMRRFILSNAKVFERLDSLELKQLATDKKVNQILQVIDSKKNLPLQGIFYNGQVFDAFQLVADLIRSAKESIILIDNYIDDTVLTLFSKRRKNVKLLILTDKISRQLKLDVEKFNAQYPSVIVREFNKAHDRFLIIDKVTVYHFGASLKDLGKKWFAFSKMDVSIFEMMGKIGNF